MNNSSLLLLSFSVGILVVIQGGINARLGILLNNTLLATTAALVMSASFTLIAVFMTVRELPSIDQIQSIPTYMWFTGGALSFLAVTLFYYIIPRIGISTAVIFGLSGQIIFAAIASHFGWFGMPMEPMTIKKVMGMIVMTLGVILIKY
ncbi:MULTISPECIES: DMT family transporter [Arenibacter]|uniref:Transporter family-2 protein n=1 Tax=Arenibacter echinorum TaxID=440515 RepID=A0A327QXB7_9FLAO|nr:MULTISPECIES: DMT family transporter [Arenibacter]MBU2906332.1 DMT family transporter [Arenibacter algicola]MCK0136143.1 DMT family transporter [Arenibacter sp. S6351L]RAJ08991.1 transporter family-2 protein [Arenibacter echinorum]